MIISPPYVLERRELRFSSRGAACSLLLHHVAVAFCSQIRHGALHNNVRMTWGKAFLPWAPSPQDALAWALEINHRFALDGGDPCSYSGVLWCFGGFDSPKASGNTPISGSIRQRPTAKHARQASRYGELVGAAYSRPTLHPSG